MYRVSTEVSASYLHSVRQLSAKCLPGRLGLVASEVRCQTYRTVFVKSGIGLTNPKGIIAPHHSGIRLTQYLPMQLGI